MVSMKFTYLILILETTLETAGVPKTSAPCTYVLILVQ